MRGSLFVPSPLLSSAGLVLVLSEREYSPLGSALAVSTASLCFLSSPRGCFRELQPLFRRIIRLHRLGLNNHACVTLLPCFASGGDCPCHIAGCGCYRHYTDD